MKGIISKLVIVALVVSSAAYAQSNNTNKNMNSMHNSNNKWICTTNASSAPSGSAGEKADKYMANHAASASSAFSYAWKNCRDCTKITCSVSKS